VASRCGISAPGRADFPYFAVTTPEFSAPVIIYRNLGPDEDGEYLVTALVGRDIFNEYARVKESGLLESTFIGQMITDAADGVFVWRPATLDGLSKE
jgi:hypothetical protein